MPKALNLVRMGEAVLQYNGVPYIIKMNGHAKFVVHANGRNAVICTATTTSDFRAVQNFFHLLKRQLAAKGIMLKPDSKRFIHNL